MALLLSRFAAAAAICALAAGASHALAQTLPGGVQQQVSTAIGAWARGGNVDAAEASIADLCSENPGIALDIVAYAGETAARAVPPEACRTSDAQCPQLDDLLSVLYQRAQRVSRPSTRAEPLVPRSPARDATRASDGSNTPCQTTGTCGGEAPPVSQTML